MFAYSAFVVFGAYARMCLKTEILQPQKGGQCLLD